MHGRQVAIDHTGRKVMSVAKISRLKTMSMRHNLGAFVGEDGDEVSHQTLNQSSRGFTNK